MSSIWQKLAQTFVNESKAIVRLLFMNEVFKNTTHCWRKMKSFADHVMMVNLTDKLNKKYISRCV